MGNTLTVEKN